VSREADQVVAVREILLEELPVAANTVVALNLLSRSRLSIEAGSRVAAGDLIARLQSWVLAERLADGTAEATERVVIDVPANPWQMAKRDWRIFRGSLGERFIARFPVRYVQEVRVVRLEARWEQFRSFPEAELEIPPPALGRGFRVDLVHKDIRVSRPEEVPDAGR
jgi:hypothetical protein